ncbi:uncharacterized protein [Apostichopus japonicus]|uniref:uncharacterized protein isoform X2 n=1 Tax=Stichopus japonicus TaxID=307972 RepID=UPI003AB16B20
MERILISLDYPQRVVDNFDREGVTTGAVQLMSGDQLDRLGVEGIGRQAILRSRCRASALNVEGDNRERAAQRETSRLFRPYSVPAPNQRRKRLLSLTVMCLALPSTKIIPSKFQQKILQAAGLGEKKISVSSSITAVELQARLMEEFPKLKDAGGYEYLRSTAQTKLLESISLPAGGGYSAANLKFVMKQARIYLRPIQAELDLSNMTVDEVTEEDELMIECNQCQMFFAQTKLKKHVTQCGRQTQERDEHDDTRPSAHGVVTETQSCSVERDGNDRQTEPAASEIQTGPQFCAPDIIGNDTPSTSGIQNESHFHVSDRCVQDYINLIEPASPSPSESDTDDDMKLVLEESLRDLDKDHDETALVAQMQSKLVTYRGLREAQSVDLVIRRKKVIKTATDVIRKQTEFSFYKDPVIHFSGEDAVDLGGPKREFFRLLTQQLASLSIFEGKPGKLYFSHDIDLLEMGKYKLAGQFIAWSVLHGGPGFPMLHPGLYNLMVGKVGKPEEQIEISDVTDIHVLCHLKMIEGISSESMIDPAVAAVSDWAANSGYSKIYSLSIESKEDTIKALVKQHVFYRCKAEVEEFQEGMDSVGGFWQMIAEEPMPFKPLLTSTAKELTFTSLKKLFKVNWSDDIVKEDQEGDTVFCWEQFLQKCQAGECSMSAEEDDESVVVGMHHILRFCTGADSIPPIGFEKQIDISFYTPVEGIKPYPTSSTCGLELHLPRGITDADKFARLMTEAILCSPGFGKQ